MRTSRDGTGFTTWADMPVLGIAVELYSHCPNPRVWGDAGAR